MNYLFVRNPLLLFFCLCQLLALSACMFSSKATKTYLHDAEKKQYDAVIVPGVPFENGVWSKTMKGRVYWSKYLYDKGIAKNIIYSGNAVYSPYYEAEIMAQYGRALGIPSANIFTEDSAKHSTENVYYSYKLARKLGFKTVALASDRFQTKQLRKFIRKRIDPAVGLIPFVSDTLKKLEPGMIDPPVDYNQSFKKGFISIKEKENFWKRWRGTRGKNIDTSLYN